MLAYPMIDGLIGSQISLNGQLMAAACDQAKFCFEPAESKMFYEVIRIEQQIPLFWEDHYDRLVRSIDGAFPIPPTLYQDSLALIQANGIDGANLRVVLTADQTVIHEIPSYYPTAQQMAQGVPTGILRWERQDPNVKVIHSDYKKAVADRFAAGGPFGQPFELLLCDHLGELTEGSRSNLFFIRGNQVLSAPDDRILKGITRKYVTRAIAAAGAELVIQMIDLDELQQGTVEAAFLSGSPIDLLPISSIESTELQSAAHPLFQQINRAYQQILQNYLQAHKS